MPFGWAGPGSRSGWSDRAVASPSRSGEATSRSDQETMPRPADEPARRTTTEPRTATSPVT